MLSEFAAFIGAFTGGLSFLWLVFRHFSDRAKLEVRAFAVAPAVHIDISKNERKKERYGEIHCSLTNIGRQVAYPIKMSFQYGTAVLSIDAGYTGFPVRLEPGAYGAFRVPLSAEGHDLLSNAYAEDSHGRRYCMPRKAVKRLAAQIKSIHCAEEG